ncbi:hypothetical protein ACMCNP_00745 [Candidatus Acidulodesulfobacterium sp. H_13]|uniref:hypothetical protein n=1 Tax=Candidatus Acidulodesulfobacterium sp. H_13 TaxID=3395470 RepID=UPI003AF71763
MMDLVEIQQIISNLSSIEKIASSSHALAVNSGNIAREKMENTNEMQKNIVVELSEVLEPVNDEKEKPKKEKEEKPKKEKNPSHVDLIL